MIELSEFRNKHSKTFDIGGGKRRLFIGGPISHYLDEDSGKVLDVDLTINDEPINSGFTHYFKNNHYRYEIDSNRGIINVYLKRNSNSRYIELRANPYANQPVSVQIENKCKIKILWTIGKVEYSLILSDEGVKVLLILNDIAAPNIFKFGYKFINIIKDGKKIKDKITSEILGILQDAWLEDSSLSNIRRDVSEQFDFDAGIVTLTADLTGLTAPIKVDPTLNLLTSLADTSLIESNPDTNFGALSNIFLDRDAGEMVHSILKFDATAIPDGQQIDSATLGLRNWTGNYIGDIAWAYRLIRTDWIELEATWNRYKAGFLWTNPGGDYTVTDGVSTILKLWSVGYTEWIGEGMKNQVQFAYSNTDKIPHYLIKVVTGSGASFQAGGRLQIPTYRPRLTIDYSEAPVGSVAIMRRRRN